MRRDVVSAYISFKLQKHIHTAAACYVWKYMFLFAKETSASCAPTKHIRSKRTQGTQH